MAGLLVMVSKSPLPAIGSWHPHVRLSAFQKAGSGLFAGMGATSLITRRASKAAMERLVIEGATIGAGACLQLGIIDEIREKPRGALLAESRGWGQREWSLNRAKTAIRRRAKHYTYVEIRGGLSVWEAAVLSMSEEDIEAATRIARMQALRSQRRLAK